MKSTDLMGICCTETSTEWTRLRVLQNELEAQPTCSEERPENGIFPDSFPQQAKATLISGLPASVLLQQVFNLPTTDPAEIAGMVELQVDKISPYPIQQLIVTHEILHQTETHTQILLLCVQRQIVEKLGESFRAANQILASLDSNLFCRWKQIQALAENPGVAAYLIFEANEIGLVVTQDNIPLLIRAVHADANNAAELLQEIEYDLATLEHHFETQSIDTLQIWSDQPRPELENQLESEIHIQHHDLSEIAPLSSILAHRFLDRKKHALELVPADWLESARNKKLLRKLGVFGAILLGSWALVAVTFFSLLGLHQSAVQSLRDEAAELREPAAAVRQASQKVRVLQTYTDQSASALETLREISSVLPKGIELSIFSFKKNNALTLRGQAENSDAIYLFFDQLAETPFFSEIKEQRVNNVAKKGKRISEFSLIAVPAGNDS